METGKNEESILQQIREEQIRQGEQIKTLFKQQEELKKLTESVYKLSGSVEKMAVTVAATDKNVEKLNQAVTEIKEKPAKRWDGAITVLITALLTAAVTFALTRLGIK